jgi:hypothetical protein
MTAKTNNDQNKRRQEEGSATTEADPLRDDNQRGNGKDEQERQKQQEKTQKQQEKTNDAHAKDIAATTCCAGEGRDTAAIS